jgi:hypothetical protein
MPALFSRFRSSRAQREAKMSVGARRKTSAKKRKRRARNNKRLYFRFSSLCRTTLETRFQSPKPLVRGKSKGLEYGLCMSMLHVLLLFPVACSCCLSVLHVRSEFLCFMFTLMSMLRVHATCPRCRFMLRVHSACPCGESVLHVHASCPLSISMSMLLVHTACPCLCRMS